jgi:hypothetical protein
MMQFLWLTFVFFANLWACGGVEVAIETADVKQAPSKSQQVFLDVVIARLRPAATGALTRDENAKVTGAHCKVLAKCDADNKLRALRKAGTARIMGDPRVVTLNGRRAEVFLSDGEVPVPCMDNNGAETIDYVEYGTRIAFLPIVKGNGKIYLEVRPELKTPCPTAGTTIGTTTVPGFNMQSANVAVEMAEGQTLTIGGLTACEDGHLPILGSVPFIGSLLQQIDFGSEEQEVVIMVTPRLVNPTECTTGNHIPCNKSVAANPKTTTQANPLLIDDLVEIWQGMTQTRSKAVAEQKKCVEELTEALRILEYYRQKKDLFTELQVEQVRSQLLEANALRIAEELWSANERDKVTAIILRQIENARGPITLTPAHISRLENEGLSDRIIDALKARSKAVERTDEGRASHPRMPVLPPMVPEGSSCEDPPGQQEILRAMPRVSRGVSCVYNEYRDDVEFTVEKMTDRVDPPRAYPFIGQAQLHRCHWKCTVYFTETIELGYPSPFRARRRRAEVVYIDKDHLHVCPASASSVAPTDAEFE